MYLGCRAGNIVQATGLSAHPCPAPCHSTGCKRDVGSSAPLLGLPTRVLTGGFCPLLPVVWMEQDVRASICFNKPTAGRAPVGLNWWFGPWQSPLRSRIFCKARGSSACFLLILPEMTESFSSGITSTR